MIEDGYSLCAVCYKNYNKFKMAIESWIETTKNYKKEINIATNGLQPDIIDMLDILKEKYSFINVLYFSENIGVAKALNSTFLSAKYKYIIKLDDDTIIPKINNDWLLKLRDILDSDNKIGMATGVAIAAAPTKEYVIKKLSNIYFNIDIEDLKDLKNTHYRDVKIKKLNNEKLSDIEVIATYFRENNNGIQEFYCKDGFSVQGCLAMFKRELLEKYGLLVEFFGLHGGDDIEFDFRLKSQGFKNITDTSLYYVHWV
jgi:GT2 family glycosyltransferase